jgi:hypothetical protein
MHKATDLYDRRGQSAFTGDFEATFISGRAHLKALE